MGFAVRNSVQAPDGGHLPPTLKSHRFLGHLEAVKNNPLELFEQARSLGDLVRLRVLHIQAFGLYHPDYVKYVCITNKENYVKQTNGYEKLRLLLGDGLVTSEGDFWRRQRRIAQPAFARKSLEGFVKTMTDSTELMLKDWSREEQPNFDIAEEMVRLTLRIAGLTLFSCDLSDESDVLSDAIHIVLRRFNELAMSALPFAEKLPTKKNAEFHNAREIMERIVYDMIQERRNSTERHHDLLSMFVHTKDADTGEGMTNKQLRDEALTMLLAGHETTANALTWAFYLLSQHPEIARKVQEEVAEVLGEKEPTFAKVGALTYTTQVFKESMRLFPPIWAVTRKALKEDVIGGFHIPRGAHAIIPIFSIHRHPRLWENPEVFDPDRFLPEKMEARKAAGWSKYCYMPFSIGQRKCIGDHFATMEGVLILAMVMRKYQLHLHPEAKIELQGSLSLRPKNGIPMFAKRRSL